MKKKTKPSDPASQAADDEHLQLLDSELTNTTQTKEAVRIQTIRLSNYRFFLDPLELATDQLNTDE